MKSWSDIQIAYQVAKFGTLSKAAESLGVHHSTVLRHIDSIEEHLACKLFHRHSRGYTPTEAGEILFQDAAKVEERLDRMVSKINGLDQQLTGPLVLTSVSTLSPLIMPVIEVFSKAHPGVDISFQADSRIFKLEYGEAHISIRPGAQPQDPDYVVQKLLYTESALYASESYLRKYGKLQSLEDITGHRFLNFCQNMNNIPSIKWLNEMVPKEQISFSASDYHILMDAAENGLGIVAMDCRIAELKTDLQLLLPAPSAWRSTIWLVTHRDVHFSPKVQAFTALIKQCLK
ncbi:MULTISPECIES: LysR family transcriptional regulator [unclassified Oleiphilus]|jgi:DNA-binding transcriptional LysR family regulator|uniref:LysR family transcriptional regulator n=3 Tax=Oleiphilus TaxID=141450 RepID=UPI0007C3C048|nr:MULTISPECIES: LysR family transcriptional regulator [unclassified Oleiphilus]KZY50244.1 LysR family transcriptional regulator [Oleiphilus sp. HI0050]KZY75635.1 LysR family transcriptional regulator [Oleiphilus sp. HI0069]KZY85541.1 LysR family transcriptional regulator [Oleiphilus sp. HI0072]KZZ21313.1 LysR family transcriptional regulator [Oleiphilus sp. HI0081]KZY39876.1 LysR family transcriptional regulator [Oleiphilus sp. HI0043]